MNKIIVNENSTLTLEIQKCQEIKKIIWLEENKDININLDSNSSLELNIINIDSSIKINANLNGENSKLKINNSIISKNDNKIVMDIYHKNKKTISKVINHGINLNDRSLVYDINAKVYVNSEESSVSQDNKIINFGSGKCEIKPNLLIDEFDGEYNHSAYISKFNDDEIFYLMSRGINKELATRLLTKSFLINEMTLDNEIMSKYIEFIERSI